MLRSRGRRRGSRGRLRTGIQGDRVRIEGCLVQSTASRRRCAMCSTKSARVQRK